MQLVWMVKLRWFPLHYLLRYVCTRKATCSRSLIRGIPKTANGIQQCIWEWHFPAVQLVHVNLSQGHSWIFPGKHQFWLRIQTSSDSSSVTANVCTYNWQHWSSITLNVSKLTHSHALLHFSYWQSEGTLLATGSYDGFARIWTKDGENTLNH